MHRHPIGLQVIPVQTPIIFFELSFRRKFCTSKILQVSYVHQSMSRGSSIPRLIKKGSIHIPTFITSSLRILGAMVNGALSPHRVPEIPYYGRKCSSKVRAPSYVRWIIFHPIKTTGECYNEPEGQGRRIVRRPRYTHLIQSIDLYLSRSSRLLDRH